MHVLIVTTFCCCRALRRHIYYENMKQLAESNTFSASTYNEIEQSALLYADAEKVLLLIKYFVTFKKFSEFSKNAKTHNFQSINQSINK